MNLIKFFLVGSILALGLMAAAAGAEEIVTPLGDKWYGVTLPYEYIIPSGGVILARVCLDDVPGGIDGVPLIFARNLPAHSPDGGGKKTLIVTPVGFAPHPFTNSEGTEIMSYITARIECVSTEECHVAVKVMVRGRE